MKNTTRTTFNAVAMASALLVSDPAIAESGPGRFSLDSWAAIATGVPIVLTLLLAGLAVWRTRLQRDKALSSLAIARMSAGSAALAADEQDFQFNEDAVAPDDAPSRDIPVPVVPQALIDAALYDDLVVVAGNSTLIRQSAPSWQQFLQTAIVAANSPNGQDGDAYLGGLAKRSLHKLAGRGGDDVVIDWLERQLGRDALAELTRQSYEGSRATSAFAEFIRDVPVSAVISLAFDDVFREMKMDTTVRTFTANASRDFEVLARTHDRFLLELAGSLSRPGTISWTSSQLKAMISRAPDLRSSLTAILGGRTSLFVGLDVSEIEALWDTVGMYGPSATPHFALIHGDPDFELIAQRLLHRYNIHLLEIGDAAALEAVLDIIKRQVALRRPSAGTELPSDAGSIRSGAIRRLKLVNIGPFKEVDLEFATAWSVLLGDNGAGKSTILRATALALSGTDRQAERYSRHMLRRGEKFGSIELTLATAQRTTIHRVALTLEGDRVNLATGVSPLQAGTLVAFGFTAVRGVSLPDAMEPISSMPDQMPRPSDVLPLLRGGLDVRNSDLQVWLRTSYALVQDDRTSDEERERTRRMIDAFFEVVDDLAPGFDIRFSRVEPRSGEILLNTSDGEIPLDYVSQGMSSMIGWVGVLVQRLYEITEPGWDPLSENAILLIDEIDSHLHPEWQQRLIPTIRRHFPNLQVIASTHSALMVGSLGDGDLIKIARGRNGLQVDRIERSFEGYRVDQILTDEPFDMASSRDPDWEAKRKEYASLLGLSTRTAEQEERYLELDAAMDAVPPPYEGKAERVRYEHARVRLDELVGEGGEMRS